MTSEDNVAALVFARERRDRIFAAMGLYERGLGDRWCGIPLPPYSPNEIADALKTFETAELIYLRDWRAGDPVASGYVVCIQGERKVLRAIDSRTTRERRVASSANRGLLLDGPSPRLRDGEEIVRAAGSFEPIIISRSEVECRT